ncbi:hypothetical protein PGTUg99_028853 [Puccinia graminis f. sp. tritici]|uniref:Uncharacterized protein n=1 Tax=Puccinia graminis f. sp. tritici TaxID=56615 RepID=A0A5B0S7I3_PUCGR|nr:hypothetical protein PGTUg99_028853 [Puccinia graminis f. sp. tritici]
MLKKSIFSNGFTGSAIAAFPPIRERTLVAQSLFSIVCQPPSPSPVTTLPGHKDVNFLCPSEDQT